MAGNLEPVSLNEKPEIKEHLLRQFGDLVERCGVVAPKEGVKFQVAQPINGCCNQGLIPPGNYKLFHTWSPDEVSYWGQLANENQAFNVCIGRRDTSQLDWRGVVSMVA